MNTEDLSKIVSLFNIAAIKAGEKIMENYMSSKYEIKHDGSPLTIADLEANKIITEILSSEIADIKIVSEENEEIKCIYTKEECSDKYPDEVTSYTFF